MTTTERDGIDEPVRVTALGESASGKTTYLAALTSTFASGGRLSAELVERSDYHELIAVWSRLCAGTRPQATAGERAKAYTWLVRFESDALVRVEINDHRGGALRDPTDAADAQALRERAVNSDAFLVFLDGSTCIEWLQLMGRAADGATRAGEQHTHFEAATLLLRSKFRIEDVTALLNESRDAARVQGKPLPPVAIVVTKLDVVQSALDGVLDVPAVMTRFLPSLMPGAFHQQSRTAVIFSKVELRRMALDEHQARLVPYVHGIAEPVLFVLSEALRRREPAFRARVEEADARLAANRQVLALAERKRIGRARAVERAQRELAAVGLAHRLASETAASAVAALEEMERRIAPFVSHGSV